MSSSTSVRFDRTAPVLPATPPSVDAPLAGLRAALGERLQGLPVHLDLGFAGGRLGCPEAPPGLRLLAVRLGPRHVHLAAFEARATAAAGPCCECLDRRMRSLRPVDEQWALQCGHRAEGFGAPFLVDSVMQTIACIGETLVRAPRVAPRVATLDLVTQEVRIDDLLGDAFCLACAPPAVASRPADAGLVLRDALPARSGRSRLRGLLEHRLPTGALVNPVCGAAAAHAIPGYAQALTAPIFGEYLQRAGDAPPRRVGWSGLCLRADESRSAGLLEALERQAGMRSHPAATAAVGSYRELAAEAIDPALCFAYNDASYERDFGLTRYDPDLPLEWTWGHSLMRRRPVLVPRQLVFYDRIDVRRQTKLVDNNSSGCALGACFEEAILKGLLELIERDSFVIAWHRRLALPRLDASRCRDRKVAALHNRLDHLGFDIALLDGRMDLDVPTVIAVARRRDGGVGAMTVGAAASLDPAEAARSALLECATSIVEMPAMFRAVEPRVRALAEDHGRVESVMDHSLLYALPHMAEQLRWLDGSPVRCRFDDAYTGFGEATADGGDIGADLQTLLAALRRCGLDEAVAIDLTTPEQRQLDLKTVRVIVPGLAPIDFGHPRNRVEKLPRFLSAPRGLGVPGGPPPLPNPLPHPFP